MKSLAARASLMMALLMGFMAYGSVSFAQGAPAQEAKKQTKKRSHVDLVIALDTSGSMDGLIDSARQKLWDIVNELATAKPTPILRVGLVSFGNDGYDESGWTRVDQDLTDDLDLVYEKLMALSTNGGTEYVGRAIHVAHHKMSWNKDRKALKMLFVAGNESADQDREKPALQEAASIIKDDVIVNTIFCGNESDQVAGGWKNVALRADGKFASISKDGGAVVIATPYDDELAKLGSELNNTYVAYGSLGVESQRRQRAEDKKAKGLSSSAGAARASAKASSLYRNSKWDLVDAESEGVAVTVDALPPEMQKMNKAERKKYLEKKAQERAKIQEKIAKLSKKRETHIKAEKKKLNRGKKDAFDEALSGALREQAKRKNISF